MVLSENPATAEAQGSSIVDIRLGLFRLCYGISQEQLAQVLALAPTIVTMSDEEFGQFVPPEGIPKQAFFDAAHCLCKNSDQQITATDDRSNVDGVIT